MPYDNDEKDERPSQDKKLLETSMQRFDLCVEAESKRRELALEDLRFRAGEQWPEEIRAARKAKGRPCLTINVLPARERQILNDQRQNRPAIKVHPVDDKADPETAKVFQGVIRHIEVDSSADAAYDNAVAAAVRYGGPGWIRVVSEYENPFTTRQVLKIKRVRNSFSVYSDPNAQEADRSDIKFLHYFCDYTRAEYEHDFPDSELASLDDWGSVGDSQPDWLSEDGIRVVEYWYIEEEEDEVYVLADGSEALKSRLGEFDPVTDARLLRDEEGKPISRATSIPVVRCCIHNAKEILKKSTWKGRWIPWVPVMGDELDVDGELVLEGMVRHAKDAVRMANIMVSAQSESIAMIPKTKWMVAEGQIPQEYEALWRQIHQDILPYMVYKPTAFQGEPVPPPQPIQAEPAVQAITQARTQFNEDLKSVTGIYDAQLGAQSNEVTGRAILARQQQGQLGNFHFVDNLTRALRFLGRILVDAIPKYYDTPRVLRILGEDGAPSTALVNGSKLPLDDPRRAGLKQFNDLDVGTYDVVAAAGPSYQTRRMEAVATQLDLLKFLPPQVAMSILDLVVGNMDIPGREDLVERLKKLLPPGMAEDEKQAPIPPQVQQKMQQMAGMVEQLTKALNEATGKLEAKKPELEAKERIALLNAQVKVLEMMSKEDIVAFQEELRSAQRGIRAMMPAEERPAQAMQ